MFPLQVAFRFLKSSIGQTILIILGISVGVSVQVFIGSLIGGLQNSLVDTTIGNSSQITITSEEYISNYSEIRDDVLLIDGIKTVSFAIDAPGSIIVEENTSPILVRGFDLQLSEDIYELEEKIIQGDLPQTGEVIVGVDLLEELNLVLGDTITVSIPLIGETEVSISGVYDFNVSVINNSWVVTDLSTAQTIIDQTNIVSSVEMQLDDVFTAEELSLLVENELSDDYKVSNWIANNQELLTGLQAQGSSSLMIQVFVTISVVLGIASVLAITVIQKSKQIGILKAMGVKDRTASFIFLSQGFILGIFGAIGGILLGLGLTYVFSTFAVDPDGNPVVPLLLDPQFIAISAFVAIISASLASVIPARKSTKISIIEVIKNG